MLMLKNRVGAGQKIFCCTGQWIKNLLLIHFWKRLVVTANLIVPCCGVAAEKAVTTCVVSIRSMDAQTSRLVLRKTRMKCVDLILVCKCSTTRDTNAGKYNKFSLKFLFCSSQCVFWLHQVTLRSRSLKNNWSC